jgi:hypothetical protein
MCFDPFFFAQASRLAVRFSVAVPKFWFFLLLVRFSHGSTGSHSRRSPFWFAPRTAGYAFLMVEFSARTLVSCSGLSAVGDAQRRSRISAQGLEFLPPEILCPRAVSALFWNSREQVTWVSVSIRLGMCGICFFPSS